jgi:hypothetical protein
MANPASPAILKTAYLPSIAPYNLVIAVAEKRRIKVNKVYAAALHRLEYLKIITKY